MILCVKSIAKKLHLKKIFTPQTTFHNKIKIDTTAQLRIQHTSLNSKKCFGKKLSNNEFDE